MHVDVAVAIRHLRVLANRERDRVCKPIETAY
jgi:hypothetical protein